MNKFSVLYLNSSLIILSLFLLPFPAFMLLLFYPSTFFPYNEFPKRYFHSFFLVLLYQKFITISLVWTCKKHKIEIVTSMTLCRYLFCCHLSLLWSISSLLFSRLLPPLKIHFQIISPTYISFQIFRLILMCYFLLLFLNSPGPFPLILSLLYLQLLSNISKLHQFQTSKKMLNTAGSETHLSLVQHYKL